MPSFPNDPDTSLRLDFQLMRDGPVTLFWRQTYFDDALAWLRGAGYNVAEIDVPEGQDEGVVGVEFAKALGFPMPWPNLNFHVLTRGLQEWKKRAYEAEATLAGTVVALRHYDRFATRDIDKANAVLQVLASDSWRDVVVGRRMMVVVQTDDPDFAADRPLGPKAKWNPGEWPEIARHPERAPRYDGERAWLRWRAGNPPSWLASGGSDRDRLLKAVETLVSATPFTDEVKREVDGLAEVAPRDASEVGALLLDEKDPQRRETGARLVGLAMVFDESLREQGLPILRRVVETETVSGPLAEAIDRIGRIEDAASHDSLLALVHHPDRLVRHAVAAALPHVGFDEPVIAALRDLSRDTDDEVRRVATHALSRKLDADDPATRDALLARVDDPVYMTRVHAMLGLSRRRDERVRQSLMRALAEPGRSRRRGSSLLDKALDFLELGPGPERLAAIRRVLLRKWDPIGVWYGDPCPAQDEYDFYIPRISAALEAGSSEDEIADLLAGYRTGSMGLRPNLERDRTAAAHLIDWEQSQGRHE